MSESKGWEWFEIKFSLGVPPEDTLPSDPALFFKWLMGEPSKFAEDIQIVPAVLRTAPF